MNIFINGVSSKIGGGKNILDNYILTLKETEKNNNHYYFLTPSAKLYTNYESDKIQIIDVPNWLKNNSVFFLLYFIVIPRILRKYKIDRIINFADIIIPTKVKQIYFFDWPYAVYENSYLWVGMKLTDFFIRKTKIFLIANFISSVDIVICQTGTIKRRLKERYNIKNILVAPTPVNFLGKETGEITIRTNKVKLFYPANDSTHKNHKFVLQFIEKIQEQELPYVVVLTLDSEAFRAIYGNLAISSQQFVINLGRLRLEDMPSVYKNIDYLFFPSLLETYGIPYIEAMYFGKPILTSELDFAKDICGDAAMYFDPLDPNTAIEQLKFLDSNQYKKENMETAAAQNLKRIPTWAQTISRFENIVENI